jgi:hypothetical protein
MCTEAVLVQGGERSGPFGMPGHGSTPAIDRVVQPGSEVTVEAIFDPNAHGPAGIGRANRVISVEVGTRTLVELKFTAYVTP